jgi:hypothetical protein
VEILWTKATEVFVIHKNGLPHHEFTFDRRKLSEGTISKAGSALAACSDGVSTPGISVRGHNTVYILPYKIAHVHALELSDYAAEIGCCSKAHTAVKYW